MRTPVPRVGLLAIAAMIPLGIAVALGIVAYGSGPTAAAPPAGLYVLKSVTGQGRAIISVPAVAEGWYFDYVNQCQDRSAQWSLYLVNGHSRRPLVYAPKAWGSQSRWIDGRVPQRVEVVASCRWTGNVVAGTP